MLPFPRNPKKEKVATPQEERIFTPLTRKVRLAALVFIFATTWVVITTLTVIGKQGYRELSAWWVKKKGQRRLHALTADERRVLSGYVENEVRAQIFHAAPDLGAAQALVNDGILYRPGVMQGEPVAVPYNIYEWALEYLSKNKGLIAPVVSAQTRWSHAGRWQAVGLAIGKLLLAIVAAYAGFMLASLVLTRIFSKIAFIGILICLYVWDEQRKAAG